MITNHLTVPAGLLLPHALLESDAFAALAAFVAINTVMYVALAVAKILPKVYVSDWIRRSNERSEPRGIIPENATNAPSEG
ncbi:MULTISPECIES: hypothetical protein [Micrococcaceae]|uniref:hypothetical protein n=1 Tax=Micrococcaceae TaxID=1268 RepID=UPI001D001206|nr:MULTISPECIES: hypothetical protein [Micrococcaceae]MCB5281423.1 hypothetical protein [Arthrobacter sp. ES1]MDJ0353196.1 hypothetical protein [Pseudarthrobacter sp. PH31-O2]WGZ80088.1 hypothetical protein QI450_02255 [Arthrobacter sp. EM1]